MEAIIYFLIGAVVVLLASLSNISREIKRVNERVDKIMDALNIEEYDRDALNSELKSILSDKGKVKAVKKYRDITGAGLKEANDYVDKLIERNN